MNTVSKLRQAAVLLSALPKPQVAAILKRLSPAQAAAVSDQLSQISGSDTAEFHRAVRQFVDLVQAGRNADNSNPAETTPTTDSQTNNEQKPAATEKSPAGAERNHLLDLLEELPLERCLDLLQAEEPAFLAAVLFLVSAKRCAEIVERMELGNRTRVLRELATISEIPAATVDHIRRQLQRKLEFGSTIHARPEGLHRLRQMLEHLDPSLQGTIADSLATSDPALAAELHRNVFRFNDLLRLSRSDLKKVLQHVDTAWWAPALRHADPRLRQHIFAAMAGAAVKILTAELDALQDLPVDLSTVRQSQIVQILQELFRKRIINRPATADSRSQAA